ncbi:MAG: LPS export ABC transporter periplasmic protein LptC [Balneolaceae bacterium]|nr:LPS export ABC transporter periplasmic protein LptC [Balneolaceae bacterium]MBO6547377.1 LPS export ABC transporter periplasmic protein LptC [Balneolaceae bacterium]MBO6647676.1 LPS export ABC transporter periplasmic protein LptC [Balneolaceae bacterium]
MPTSCPDLVMQETDILVRFSLLSGFIFSLFVLSCSNLSEYDNQQIKEALADSILSTTESWDVNMNIIEDGIRILNLKGDYAFTIKQTDLHETRISGPVSIKIFKENGQLKSTVTCDSALYKPDDAQFEMFGEVRVITEDGRKLRSEYLKWERKIDQVSTPEFVIFISPPDSIAANGFYGDTDLTNYTLNEGGGQVVID